MTTSGVTPTMSYEEVEEWIDDLGIEADVKEWTRRAARAMGIVDLNRYCDFGSNAKNPIQSLRRVIGEAVIRGMVLAKKGEQK